MQPAPSAAWGMHFSDIILVRVIQFLVVHPLTLIARHHVWPARQSSLYSSHLQDYGGADGTTSSINTNIIGISVSCLQLTDALGALIAGRLGDIIGRKKCVRIGGFIYFFSAFIQIFAPNFATFVTGRTIQGIGVGFLSMVSSRPRLPNLTGY